MLAISVSSNIAQVMRELSAVKREQLPFAAAKTLTETARDARDEQRGAMSQRFTVRRPWVVQGIRSTSATKANLTAEVYDADPFMVIQETGGEKVSIRSRVFDYGEYLAIPLDARRSKRDVVDKRDWPQNLVNPFILTARDGRQYLAVHQFTVSGSARDVRAARGRQRRSSGNRLMYVLVKREAIKARLALRPTVMRVVEERFPPRFAANLDAAIASAR